MGDVEQSAAWRASRRAARRYRETRNPLYAWEAAGLALAAGIPMPAAVLAYVTRAAQKLGAPGAARIASPAQHVFQCLEIAGPGPSAFERRRRFERDRAVQTLADAVHRNLRIARADALERVAEDANLDADSVRRQARKRKKLAEISPHASDAPRPKVATLNPTTLER